MKLPAKIAIGLMMSRGQDFLLGWNNGVQRYNRRAGDIIGPSGYEPKEDPTAYAASEAAVAYCCALERTR